MLSSKFVYIFHDIYDCYYLKITSYMKSDTLEAFFLSKSNIK